MVVPSLSW
jgi:hypothetical protein